MTNITDPEVDSLIVQLRAHRSVLDELVVEYKRLHDERHARWAALDDLADALRANPSRETCDAYFGVNQATNAIYDRESGVDQRRHKVIEEMRELQHKLHALLGIDLKQSDYNP
jgi:hypothetical protein